ncbi:TetR/AcrR family transcriptional regulator [Companilactobacillus nuruki]|uniref:TetR family transcriptional regulator n=1 Tax=Companilactobacillus nuruki TaxID=1993540 RepID=A0A2N7ATQ3_9LACO|nr:TetR/AcrR family transcriptional regulator [Companilactobacillus nuruki]PMD69844.1 TetR family transcriptional regulator [Companilactobacillus nuruki]
MEKTFQDLSDWLATSDMPNGKKKVLKASLQLFSKQGYDGTSTAEIAKLSGMSQATIFKYFKSKDDLLLFILEPMIDHILPTYGEEFAKQVNSSNYDLESLVQFIVRNRFEFLVQNRDAAIILISQVLINDKVRNMLLDKVMSLKDLFFNNIWKALKDTGEMREDVDPIEWIRMVIGQIILYFLQSQRILDTIDDKQLDHDLSQIEDSVVRAIKK